MEDIEQNRPQLLHPNLNQKKAKGFRAFHFSSQIEENIKRIGYKNPTPIQKRVIPEIMSGFNIIAHSRTGSGKTAAFLLPILDKLKHHSEIVGVRCLILSPTRELAHQTANFCRKLCKGTNLRLALLLGGNELDNQFAKLAQNPDIVIATPGRACHHIAEHSLDLKKLEIIIVDEADKMLELNFEEQLKDIMKACPFKKQTLMFSATIQDQFNSFLKKGIIQEYKLVNIQEESKIPERLKIHLIYTRKEEKIYSLISLFDEKIINLNRELTLVFVMTKYHCDYIQEFLKYWNIKSLIIYGQMEQDLRMKNMNDFKGGKTKLLVVTDLAARGLDIPYLDNVINFDFPDTNKLFVHRVGRTARAGRSGRVFNLATSDELPFFFDIKYYLGKEFNLSDSGENTIDNCNEISFGSVPNKVITNIKGQKEEYLFNSKADMEQLYISMINAEKKGMSYKQKPSLYGVKQAKKLLNEVDMRLHPFYVEKYEDVEKQQFLNELKHYKPKENYFEQLRDTSVNEGVISEFKKRSEDYKRKKMLEKEKEKMMKAKEVALLEKEEKELFDVQQKEEVKLLGRKLKREKLNKKAKKQSNNNINDNNNNNANDDDDNEYKPQKQLRIKRSQIINFLKPNNISQTKQETNTSLWGGERPIELDELTLNINTDDTLQNRKKTVWDNKKKNFVFGKVDKSGKILNESGKLIKKDSKYHPYQNWRKKSKMSIQSAGEIEQKTTVNIAREKIKERRELKNKKSDLKSFDQVLKEKKRLFKDLQKKNKQFSKRQMRQSQMHQQANLNRRSQAFVKLRKRR